MNDRYVLHNLHAEYPGDVVAELPPGTHRVTVRYDGTIEVVGLVPTNDGWTEWADVPPVDGEMRWMRVVADMPPKDGAR